MIQMIDKRVAILVILLCVFLFWWDDINLKITGVKKDEDYIKEVKRFAVCTTNDDCVVLYGKCGVWEAVNKKNVNEARRYFEWKNSSATCRFEDIVRPCNLSCYKGVCTVDKNQDGCPQIYHNEF